MSIVNYTFNRRPTCVVRGWLTQKQIEEINEFLLRVLNSYLNTTNGWFALRDFVGGNNRNWTGAAWDYVYRVHYSNNPDTAYVAAAKDMGWFFMNLLKSDSRQFETSYIIRTSDGRKIKVRVYHLIQ